MTMDPRIKVNLQLFAVYQEVCHARELVLEVAPGTSVGELLNQLIARYPTLADWQPVTTFAVNQQLVRADWALESGDEVVFLPPPSGG